MIDDHGCATEPHELANTLRATGFLDPARQKAQERTLKALDADPDLALLGILVDHLLVHAESDAGELDVLQLATDAWEVGRKRVSGRRRGADLA